MTTELRVERVESAAGALLARHSDTRDLRDFTRYRGRPADFAREELHFLAYAKQIEILDSFVAHKQTAVRGAHGVGKDAVLAVLALYACYALGMLVLVISATERQLLGQLWREIGDRFSPRLPGELYTADLRIGGAKRILAMTSGNTSNLTGWHDPHGVCVLISESQSEQVGEAAFDAAIANAVDDASRIVVAGNPIKPAGRFYEVTRKPTWHAIRVSAFDHPNIFEGKVVVAGGPSPTWPAEMAAEFGTDSPWYISRVLGEFPSQGSVDSLVKPQGWEEANLRHEAGVAFTAEPRPLCALDVARSHDRDESCAAVVQGPIVHALHAWRSRDVVDTTGRFLAIVDRARAEWCGAIGGRQFDTSSSSWNDPDAVARWLKEHAVPEFDLHIDAPGVGSGSVDDARRRGRIVTEYWGWSPARDPQRFANLRAEVFWNLRTLVEDGVASLPRDEALREEALAIEWSQDAKGRIVILPKEELRAALGRSPDRLDAVVIALYRATVAPQTWASVRVRW